MTLAAGTEPPGAAAFLRLESDGGAPTLFLRGDWTVVNAGAIDAVLHAQLPAPAGDFQIDLGEIATLDTSGAWLAWRTLRGAGAGARFINAAPAHAALIEQVAGSWQPGDPAPPETASFQRVLERVGMAIVEAGRDARYFVGFLGLILVTLGRTLRNPSRFRLTSFIHHVEEVGLNALPIVGLISFLIGIVLAYQGADQLKRFGAEIFVIDLVAISVLREIGILLTAIVVAGRSGSAFTAQIGSMKLNQEIDAMRTIGMDPIEVLVLPRVVALVLIMPGLAFFADLMGLLGGGLMAWAALDISPAFFLERLNSEIDMWTLWIGMIKAPVFAFIIALVGCAEGLRVEGSAESVGRLTTASVVKSIFLVIVGDAMFSIFFATLGL